MRLLLLLPLTLLLACGSPSGGVGSNRPENDLQISIDRGDGSTPESYTLVCAGAVEGSHPRAEQACAHLTSLPAPFAPIPADAMCTQQYGGPETARVTGQWAGQPVDLALSRTNGCYISQWESLGPLLSFDA